MLCSTPCIAQDVLEEKPSDKDSIVVKEFRLLANIRNHEITGICVINISNEYSMAGTLVNEFGIKAFDFSYSEGKVEILNVMNHINKWYIRKVLKNDIRFILTNIFSNKSEIIEKKRTMKKMKDGKIIVVNNRHKISYSFLPLTGKE